MVEGVPESRGKRAAGLGAVMGVWVLGPEHIT